MQPRCWPAYVFSIMSVPLQLREAQQRRVGELTSSPAFVLKVFVIGVAGRIGRAVAEACIARGAVVKGLCRVTANAPPGVTTIQGDVMDGDEWALHLSGVDVVVCALRGAPGEILELQRRHIAPASSCTPH